MRVDPKRVERWVYVRNRLLKAPVTDLVTTIRNVDVRVHSWSLYLTGEPAQIEGGMDELAKRVLHYAPRSAHTSRTEA